MHRVRCMAGDGAQEVDRRRGDAAAAPASAAVAEVADAGGPERAASGVHDHRARDGRDRRAPSQHTQGEASSPRGALKEAHRSGFSSPFECSNSALLWRDVSLQLSTGAWFITQGHGLTGASSSPAKQPIA